MGSLRNRALGLLLLLAVAAGCREPRSSEHFLPGAGPYAFEVPMTDSLRVYDLSLYTRLDGSPSALQDLQLLPLRMVWTSPSGEMASEEVYLPLQGRRSFFSRQILVPYRADMRPVETGVWNLVITPLDPPEELRGMGLVVSFRPWDTEN